MTSILKQHLPHNKHCNEVFLEFKSTKTSAQDFLLIRRSAKIIRDMFANFIINLSIRFSTSPYALFLSVMCKNRINGSVVFLFQYRTYIRTQRSHDKFTKEVLAKSSIKVEIKGKTLTDQFRC